MHPYFVGKSTIPPYENTNPIFTEVMISIIAAFTCFTVTGLKTNPNPLTYMPILNLATYVGNLPNNFMARNKGIFII